jgi:N-acetylglutamate synthase-like GNAT family acetyltransferase
MNISFRPYDTSDQQVCADIFDANCPEFFAPNERQDYTDFLKDVPDDYEVCEGDGKVMGAFGLLAHSENSKTLCWILLDPRTQGMGAGSKIMERVIQLGQASETKTVRIAASHKSAPFFARFGATTLSTTKEGWGPGMDRIDMLLSL